MMLGGAIIAAFKQAYFCSEYTTFRPVSSSLRMLAKQSPRYATFLAVSGTASFEFGFIFEVRKKAMSSQEPWRKEDRGQALAPIAMCGLTSISASELSIPILANPV